MNLLIVDDEIEIINGIMNGVNWNKLNYFSVYQATGVETAKEVFSKNRIDIILCDIEMTDGSGLDLLEWVRAKYPDTVCLILTCHEDFEYARRAISIGCKKYILKPIVYLELEELLFETSMEVKASKENIKYQNFGRDWIRRLGHEVPENESRIDKKEMIGRVKAYVRTHLSEELKSEDLAAMLYITTDYLFRIFKQVEGKTVSDFIVEERMFLAGQLLKESRMTISRVAYECGYDNFSYFTKVFKKQFGMTPREFRRGLEPD